ncbi:MAG: hypothetical protein QNK21_22355 [Desulfosarcina sp.]|nr:hypothetical protein [Desulfosarcina sp.]MDX2455402.1 hypothetical protein [Desulfosarcina sp.]
MCTLIAAFRSDAEYIVWQLISNRGVSADNHGPRLAFRDIEEELGKICLTPEAVAVSQAFELVAQDAREPFSLCSGISSAYGG